ncbi:MAG: hypothetical protein IJR94_00400 [Synergistaceae bacterium]|nr:hypothetical protein [Synergistaceae bacterium]
MRLRINELRFSTLYLNKSRPAFSKTTLAAPLKRGLTFSKRREKCYNTSNKILSQNFQKLEILSATLSATKSFKFFRAFQILQTPRRK